MKLFVCAHSMSRRYSSQTNLRKDKRNSSFDLKIVDMEDDKKTDLDLNETVVITNRSISPDVTHSTPLNRERLTRRTESTDVEFQVKLKTSPVLYLH